MPDSKFFNIDAPTDAIQMTIIDRLVRRGYVPHYSNTSLSLGVSAPEDIVKGICERFGATYKEIRQMAPLQDFGKKKKKEKTIEPTDIPELPLTGKIDPLTETAEDVFDITTGVDPSYLTDE